MLLTTTYCGYEATGANRVTGPHPDVNVRVLSFPQVVLVPSVVQLVVDHEAAALYPDGAAGVEKAHQVGTVTTVLIRASREVLFFVENDLRIQNII